MCLAEEPQARRDRDGRATIERIGWDVVRVSMHCDVRRSWVRIVWDQVVEYANCGSFGWKIVADIACGIAVGVGCWRIERGPRRMRFDAAVLRFLACRLVIVEEICGAAGGDLVGLVDQRIDVPSSEDVINWFVEGEIAIVLIADLWPMYSARAVTVPVVWSSSSA